MSSMLRKKKSTFDESDLPTDNWIWGNSRGGGGAPLKDTQGNDVANLKKVLTGVIEVDHSPSPNSKSKHMQQNRRNNYDEDLGFNSHGNQRNNNRNNRNSMNRNSSHDYDQEEEDYPRDRRGGRNDQHQLDEPVPKNVKKSYNHYSDEAGDNQRAIPGLTDLRENPHNPNSPRHVQKVHNYNGVASPPKKYMGAIKEMNSSYDNNERDAKMRKQMEYQELLRQQIEDKQRKKDQEKAEQDAIKRRELAEFLASQAKKGIVNPNTVLDTAPPNKPPAHPNNNMKKPPRFRADRADDIEPEEYNNNSNHNNHGRNPRNADRNSTYSDSEDEYPRNSRAPAKLSLPINNAGGRGAGGRGGDRDEDRDYRGDGGGGQGRNAGREAGRGGGGGRGSHYDDGSDQDYPSDGSNDGHGSYGGRGGGRGGGGRDNERGRHTADSVDDDYVPKGEYDELSKLCDKLLTQQEQLQLEVRKQADMLKALKVKGGVGSGGQPKGSASATKATAKGATAMGLSPSKLISRSKSAVQPSRDRTSNLGSDDSNPASNRGRAASNLRANSHKETEKEKKDREKAERLRLKEFEPIKHNKVVDGKSRYGAPAKARPSSMQAPGGGYRDEPEVAVKKPPPKVAFGSNKELDKNNSNSNKSKLSQQGANVIAGGGAGGRSAAPVPRSNAGKSSNHRDDNGGGGGVNGFTKLQLANGRVSGGPAVVVHEEDERPAYTNHNANTPSPLRRGGGRGNGGGGGGRNDRHRGSAGELRGQSEYLPISGNIDMMGGDQLEKLLHQSRNARY